MYRADSALLNREMLMEGHFFGLRFYFGVRITHVVDETRGHERVWGWGYETLRGHLEQGRINFEVIKNLATGAVGFRVAGYARPARLPDPLVRLGFSVFGRWKQQRLVTAPATARLLRQPCPGSPADRSGGPDPRVVTMRFGVFVPQGWRLDLTGIDPAAQWAAMLDVARAADDGPFESIWVYDHFHTTPVPTDEATHEAWSLMAAFGAATSRVRLGQMCTCIGYRNPAYLAKVAATIDIDLRRPGRDGHRGRLVRARVAGLRLRLPVRRASASPCWTRACRSCASSGPPVRPPWTVSTTR